MSPGSKGIFVGVGGIVTMALKDYADHGTTYQFPLAIIAAVCLVYVLVRYCGA